MGEATTPDVCGQCRAGKHIDVVGDFTDDGEPIQVELETCGCWACYCMAPIDKPGGESR